MNLFLIDGARLRGAFGSGEISAGAVSIGAVAGLVLLLLAASLGSAWQATRTQTRKSVTEIMDDVEARLKADGRL